MKEKMRKKRYQELTKSYRIAFWFRWMPIGYIKGLGWYFIKRLRWEDVCDDDQGRISLDSCLGICVGMVQSKMRWYYTMEETFGDDGNLREDLVKEGFLMKMVNFLGEKFVKTIDNR